MNTGELYRTNHILDTALLYFKESGQIFDILNYKLGKAYNLGNMGLVYAEQGNHNLAEEYLVKATSVLQALGDQYPIAVFNTYMADIYKDKGDLNRALEYALQSYNIALAEGLKEQVRDASLKLSELYEIALAYDKAFFYQKKYTAYRDSINNEATIRQMADIRTEYEVAQKQTEVDFLVNKQLTYRVASVVLIGLLSMIMILAWILNKRNKEKRTINIRLLGQKHEVETQHKELEVVNATKDRFFSIISHDLRGPVNAFKGLSTLIKYSVQDKAYEQLPEITDRIENASTHLSFLLDNILDWAVNQQGEFPYKPEKVSLSEIVKEISSVFENMAQSKGVHLILACTEDVEVWADKNSMLTILRNLVNNAIKFTKEGGKVTLSSTTSENYLAFKVEDTGVGIPKEKMDALFLFNDMKSTYGTSGEKGLGLGLKLAYEFAQMNKGSITVESEEKKGTTFTVKLPQAKV